MTTKNSMGRLASLIDLEPHDFYNSEVASELAEMKRRKVFYWFNRQSRKSLERHVDMLKDIKEPVFQIIGGMVTGLVSFSKKRETLGGTKETTTYTIVLPEGENITFTEGYRGVSYAPSVNWLTRKEVTAIINSLKSLVSKRDEERNKEERKRISGIISKAEARNWVSQKI